MAPRPLRLRSLVYATLAFALLACAVPAHAATAGDYQRLLSEKSPALVTVKFILQVKLGGMMAGMGMGDQEVESELTGIMIDPKGLVLCSNTQLEGFAGMMGPMMRAQGIEITTAPTDIRVVDNESNDALDAVLVARDRELDLAWIRVADPGDRQFPAIDLKKSAAPDVGDPILVIRRMDKFFDRVAVIGAGRVGGRTTRPRDLYVPVGGVTADLGGFGLPVFTPSGDVVGVLIVQSPNEEDAGGDPMALFSSMTSVQDMMGALILPSADVVKATERAMEIEE